METVTYRLGDSKRNWKSLFLLVILLTTMCSGRPRGVRRNTSRLATDFNDPETDEILRIHKIVQKLQDDEEQFDRYSREILHKEKLTEYVRLLLRLRRRKEMRSYLCDSRPYLCET